MTEISTKTMPTPYVTPNTSSLAMTGQYPPQTFRGLKDCDHAVMTLWERLRQRDANQFLSFKHVSEKSFRALAENRGQLHATIRMTYFPDIETLIIKVVTVPHEKAHRSFTDQAVVSLATMGVDLDERELTGAAIYTAPSRSQKEGDSTYKNGLLRPRDTDWPHWVIESGVLESLPRLRQDVNWWIGYSGGKVLLALIFKVSREAKTLTIEEYFPRPRSGPSTRAQAAAGGPSFVPQLISITVVNMRNNTPHYPGALSGPGVQQDSW
ncbi:hypothetical protein BO94DRAFT_627896 [Aspergillus sclerotioniger CBS 115572]|uniref:Uncharacterized protein n=1 Tax=Aspergillus sclerotioniger CBS 115572 TaxID=1450535 RepID=A0A317VE06_9EURO|nr:hypothetical protein BO94DRAFT_627896 [Aspergillus sclerotioniger CBS 115572]PWY72185.1 hypothetical protein BO94DRAFT_627896 [Aspergillus sclerotioniger CBS 115572]